ncbi:hypothetical protein [Nafulsella turpanensis]|uniref:hypothetical protein n=1 Tax=Nafulsella turpanensis TaxID=1265690 RepID=UPI000349AC2D|nr:hypothetical protein [Nafulsella turpanensis]
MADSTIFTGLAKVGGALGKGLIAGFAGTVAITVSQMIEMQITNREASNAPVKVAGKALGVEPKGKAELEKEKNGREEPSEETQQKVEENKQKFSEMMHFSYGTSWGVFRGALDLAGIHGPVADLCHFSAVWGTAQVMLPAAAGTPPITQWSPKQIAIDAMHHAVYACAVGLTYDAMRKAEKRRISRRASWLDHLLSGNLKKPA